MKYLTIACVCALFLIGCASQRTRATCAETEYRLNSMSYSPDQRAFLEEELRQCRAEQAEQEKDDVITNKIKGSIYERFAADSTAKADDVSENGSAEQSAEENSETPVETQANTAETSVEEAAEIAPAEGAE